MKFNTTIFGASICAITLVFAACSKDDETGTGVDLKDPKSATPTTINSPQKAMGATQAMFGVTGDTSSVQGEASADIGSFTSIGALALRQLKRAQKTTTDTQAKQALGTLYNTLSNAASAVAANNSVNRMLTRNQFAAKTDGPVTVDCAAGGTITTNDQETITATTVVGKATITAVNCNNDGTEIINGTATFDYSTENKGQQDQRVQGSFQLGDGDATAESTDFVITRLSDTLAVEETTTMSLKVTYDVAFQGMDTSGSGTIKYGANGIITNDTAAGLETSLMDEFSALITLETVNNVTEISFNLGVTLDGAMEHTRGSERHYSGFVDFAMLMANVTSTEADNYSTQSINGKSVTENTPAQCQDGTYEFVTATPFKQVNGSYTEGDMTINGTTRIEVTGPDEFLVTVNGTQTPYTATDLENTSICNI